MLLYVPAILQYCARVDTFRSMLYTSGHHLSTFYERDEKYKIRRRLNKEHFNALMKQRGKVFKQWMNVIE